MQIVVIETSWIFRPSKKCLEIFFERKGWEYEVTEHDEDNGWFKYCEAVVNGESYCMHNLPRDDSDFVTAVEELGSEAGIENEWESSILKIVEVPDDAKWRVVTCECGPGEYIEEKHRTWNYRGE